MTDEEIYLALLNCANNAIQMWDEIACGRAFIVQTRNNNIVRMKLAHNCADVMDALLNVWNDDSIVTFLRPAPRA